MTPRMWVYVLWLATLLHSPQAARHHSRLRSLPLAAPLRSACWEDILAGKNVSYSKNVWHAVHSLAIDGTDMMYKDKKGVETEALASALDQVMALGVRPVMMEYVSAGNPLQVLRSANSSKPLHVLAQAKHMHQECHDSSCSSKSHKFVLMERVPGLRKNFRVNNRTKYPVLVSNRSAHFTERVTWVYLLDSLLSFKDGRDRTNCYINSDGLMFAVDYDTSQAFYKSNSTTGLRKQILSCAKERMRAFAGKNFSCEIHDTLLRKVQQVLPHFPQAMLKRLHKPFWASCPLLLPYTTLLHAHSNASALQPADFKRTCVKPFQPNLDYFDHPQFPWDSVHLLNTNASALGIQCVVDKPRVLTFILLHRLYGIAQRASMELAEQRCGVKQKI